MGVRVTRGAGSADCDWAAGTGPRGQHGPWPEHSRHGLDQRFLAL